MAPPKWPVVQLAFTALPLLLLPDVSRTFVPAPSSKAYAALRLASTLVLATVTFTAPDVVVFPLVSRATAVIAWDPLSIVRVSQLRVYGPERSSAPTFWPSTLNCTPATP